MVNTINQDKTFLKYLKLGPKGAINSVFATIDIPENSVLVYMQGKIISAPDKYSIQIDFDKHLGGDSELIDDELCHSCEANSRINFSDLSIRTKRAICAGEEITINYCASEEVLANPFKCICGSLKCYGFVTGFKNLTPSQREAIKDDISPFLKNKYYYLET